MNSESPLIFRRRHAWGSNPCLPPSAVTFLVISFALIALSLAQDQCLLHRPSFSASLMPATLPPPMHCIMYAHASNISSTSLPDSGSGFSFTHDVTLRFKVLTQPLLGHRRLVRTRLPVRRVLRAWNVGPPKNLRSRLSVTYLGVCSANNLRVARCSRYGLCKCNDGWSGRGCYTRIEPCGKLGGVAHP